MPSCHNLLLVLYARVYTRFMPRVHRLALYKASRPWPPCGPCCLPVASCGLPVVFLWSPCGLPRPPVARRGLAWLGLASIGLAALPLAVLALALPVFRSACFMAAYAVALFCFMLVLCSTRGLPCPGRSWGQHKASLQQV